MKVVEVRLGDIQVKDRAREDKGDIKGLAESIKSVGLIQPITLNKDGMKLVAGERRYLAHRLLGLDTISAIVREVADDETAFEIELVENTQRLNLTWAERAKLELKIWNRHVDKIGEYNPTTNPEGWSQHKQARLVGSDQATVSRRLELAETMEEVPDLELDTCKTEDEAWKVNSKLKEHGARLAMQEKLPSHIKEAINEASKHYIVGDAFKGMMELSEETFHFAEVDPPYGVDLDRRKGRNADKAPMDEYNEWEEATYPAFFEQVATLVYDKLKHNSFAVFWYGMSWHYEVMTILRKVGFGLPDIPAIWVKGELSGQTAAPDTTLGSSYEPFFLVRKDQPKLARPGRGNVFNYPALTKKDHPTEKPLLLIEDILTTILLPGSEILIPFLGSGVTLRAAYKLGHTGLGWDLSEQHKSSFLHRIAEDRKAKDDAVNA